MRLIGLFVALALVVGCKTEVKAQDNCGDEFLDPGEACDGTNLDGQDCVSLGHYENTGAPTCTSACTFDTAACGPRCGDNTVDVAHGEVCDSQQLTGNTCVTLGFTGGVLACGADCQYDVTGCISVCGNGVVEPDEGCDDAGTAPADGCAADCTVEPGWACAGSPSVCEIVECGDDVAAGDEPCDGTDLREQSCEGLGFHGGALACTTDCGLDPSGCESVGRCGDGTLQSSYEACDGADLGDATCETLGWHGGTGLQPSCLADCTIDESECELNGRCGDDVLQADFEDCEATLDIAQTCAREGYFHGAVTCSPQCAFDVSSCVAAVSLAAGDDHVCALDAAGAAWCWGSGLNGRLGEGLQATRYVPVPVTMPVGVSFTRISAGAANTCALDTAGAAWCWGLGFRGRNGDNSTDDRLTPSAVLMPVGRTFVQLDTGESHSCAVDQLGAAWCWGNGQNGRLGNGGWNDVSIPTAVTMPPGGISFTSISAGFGHTCAVTTGGLLYCWGYNASGQIGNDSLGNVLTPVALTLSGVTSVSAGRLTTCAVTSANQAWCWGEGEGGQLGNGTPADSAVPTLVTQPVGVSFSGLSVGADHVCAVGDDNHVWCWGTNAHGELGSDHADTSLPVSSGLPTTPGPLAVAAHARGTCALSAPGKLWCWGMNDFGQIGADTGIGPGPFDFPIPVSSP